MFDWDSADLSVRKSREKAPAARVVSIQSLECADQVTGSTRRLGGSTIPL